MITKAEAIKAIDLNAQFVIRGGVVESVSGGITGEQIETKQAELQAEYDSQEYARKRKAEYPSIEECVHAILDDDLDALQAKRAEIKARYPK